MGFACGFDIYPPLKPTELNRDKYARFIRTILDNYGYGYEDEASPFPAVPVTELDRVANIVPTAQGAYVDFEVGEHPRLPYTPDLCPYFLRFSSKVSGGRTQHAEPYIRGVGRIAVGVFGEDRVKWWHEQCEHEDQKKIFGYYNWHQIHAAEKKWRIVLDGKGELDPADQLLLDELEELADEE